MHVDPRLGFLPGGVRGGGAVAAFNEGATIDTLCWRMRVTSQSTLAHYLQEVVAATSLSDLVPAGKVAVRTLSGVYTDLLTYVSIRITAGEFRPLASA